MLFFIGTGPVRGFAVTLGIGILTTLFTAFTMTRLIMVGVGAHGAPADRADLIAAPASRNETTCISFASYPTIPQFDFIRFRRISFPMSAVLSILAITLYFTHGLNFGIDFIGGTLMEVQSKAGPIDIAKMRATLSELGLGEVQLQEFGSPGHRADPIAQQPGGEQAQQAVGASRCAARSATASIIAASTWWDRASPASCCTGASSASSSPSAAILLYLWFRFEWQFALGAMIANVHDIVLTLGFMSITQIDFDLTSIAALLTILGYSLNDTVVIYDRIREMLRRYKKMPMTDLLNVSINATLSRSVITHVTVLAGACWRCCCSAARRSTRFTATMMFGAALVGTYTSVFIASPILIYLGVGTGRQYAPDTPEEEKAGSAVAADRARPRARAPAQRAPLTTAAVDAAGRHLPRPAPIEAYGKGGFRFAGMSHRGSLLCLPHGIWASAVTAAGDIDVGGAGARRSRPSRASIIS